MVDSDLLHLLSLGHRGQGHATTIPSDATTDAWSAGRILGVDPGFLERECRAGRLPFTEYRGMTFYSIDALRRTLAGRRRFPRFPWQRDLRGRRRDLNYRANHNSRPGWQQRIDIKKRLLELRERELPPEWRDDLAAKRRLLDLQSYDADALDRQVSLNRKRYLLLSRRGC